MSDVDVVFENFKNNHKGFLSERIIVKNKFKGWFVAFKYLDKFYFGYSCVHNKDRINKDFGLKIAIRRAMKMGEKYDNLKKCAIFDHYVSYYFPYTITKERVNSFVNRCIKYFKNLTKEEKKKLYELARI